jgi:hypothetical protein
VRTLGTVVAVALWAALATRPGLAQGDAAQGGADRDAPRADTNLKGGDSAISVKPNEGLAVLLRRASRNRPIAHPAGLSANTGASNPFARRGAGDGTMRNAIGVVVPGRGQGAGGAAPGSSAHPTINANDPGPGTIGAATGAGHIGDVNVHRPAIPLNAATGPGPHTAGIGGTAISRIGLGPGHIGGPAKDRSGINGTTMRPKR